LHIVVPIIIAYLLGSVSFSYLFGKWLKGIDIRNYGSGNAGATNTLRVLGKGPAIAVLLLDALKGAVSVWIAWWIAPASPYAAAFAGLAAIIGHNWPIYFGFRGGKGIATTIGVMFSLAWIPALIAGVVAIAAIALTRFVSLGSLLFALLLPILLFFLHFPSVLGWSAVVVCVFAFIRHRNNIVKLLSGKEHKLGSKGTTP